MKVYIFDSSTGSYLTVVVLAESEEEAFILLAEEDGLEKDEWRLTEVKELEKGIVSIAGGF